MFESPANPKPSDNRTRDSETAIGSVNDAVLLEQVGHGNESAMEDIFRRYSGPVYSVALRVLRDNGHAEDVLQEVFLQLWRNPAAFVQQRGSLGAWLVVVARNRAIDHLRRRKPADSVEDVILASSVNVADEAERNTMMEKVRRVIADLPPEQQKSLELAYFEGLSHTEIASRTGDPLGTVKTRIRQALITLRKAFPA
ncbi:MAG TPA: sigma-70 family RNA polymerase sigma factor [Opitutaceae bacterium]|nr:sigma-70 family RNA polymerase sigma factor [Opitutaceae bacterium]